MGMSDTDYEAWRAAQSFTPLPDRVQARSRQFFLAIAALHVGTVAAMNDYTHTWMERGVLYQFMERLQAAKQANDQRAIAQYEAIVDDLTQQELGFRADLTDEGVGRMHCVVWLLHCRLLILLPSDTLRGVVTFYGVVAAWLLHLVSQRLIGASVFKTHDICLQQLGSDVQSVARQVDIPTEVSVSVFPPIATYPLITPSHPNSAHRCL